MKSVTILTIAAMAMAAAAGCSHDNPTPSPEPPAKGGEFNEFGFTTTVPVTLCVDYGDMDGMPSNVYFEVYDTCPVEETETAYARIAGTEPLYAGYTDEQGRFEGTIELPSYIRKAYVLTPAFYARTLLEATRSGDMLTASAESGAPANAAPASTRAKEYHSTAVERDGWKTWLGSYDTTYGSIGYEYKGDLKVKNYGALLKAHASVFDTTKKCPEEYRSSRDLYLEKSAEVVITLLGSNTCWNSSMGYYYYKTGNKPKSLADADVVMIFPNTQDGRWSNSPWESRLYQGVERGTAVQLIYYPEIADGSKAGATTVFPADYRIGFVLATNAWTNRLRAGDKKYRAATSDGLSVNNNGVAYQTPRTAVFRYTDQEKRHQLGALLVRGPQQRRKFQRRGIHDDLQSRGRRDGHSVGRCQRRQEDGQRTARHLCLRGPLAQPRRLRHERRDGPQRLREGVQRKGHFRGVVHAEDLRQLRRQRQRTRRDPYGSGRRTQNSNSASASPVPRRSKPRISSATARSCC